jgi:hypothetical protein
MPRSALGRHHLTADFAGLMILRVYIDVPLAGGKLYAGLRRRHSLRKEPPAYLIALRTRFPTMSSRTVDHCAGRTDAQIEAFPPDRIDAVGPYAVEKGREQDR